MMNGYGRHEFAKLCSMGYTSVCKYELEYSNPCKDNLKKICIAFNLPLDFFSN